jgi:hypothetical protein
LSAPELARVQAHRELAARKLKMARLLADGGLPEEARTPLLDAAFALAGALAVEARLPEPESLAEALLPPLAATWGAQAAMVHDFEATPAGDPDPVIQSLHVLLKAT